MKIFLRTVFYQFFLLFVGVAVGFIGNAEYIGWKSAIIERSFYNIFYPVVYGPEVEAYVLKIGRERLCVALNGDPHDAAGLTLLDEWVWNEEVYIAKYRVRRENGESRAGEYETRVRWKPWEYYYEYHGPQGTEVPATPEPESLDAETAPQPPQG